MALLFDKRIRLNTHNNLESEQATMFLSTNSVEVQSENGMQETEEDYVEIEIKPAHVICPDCGGITIEGLDYCHRCGGELKPTD